MATLIGTVTIGWRKHVIEIDWKDTTGPRGDRLFSDENVTTGHTYVHAWGYDKAREYLAKILA